MAGKKETFQDLQVLPFKNFEKWLIWLEKNHRREQGIWVKFAKKASGIPTASYVEVREGALMYGWIDGQKRSYDENYYLIRLTPRRKRSPWSMINRNIALQLIKENRMKPAWLEQVEIAKGNGRWDAAYGSQSEIEVPPELKKWFARNKEAKAFFDSITKANRYAFLYRIESVKRAETRERHIEKTKRMLLAREVYHLPAQKKAKKKVAKKSIRRANKLTAQKGATKSQRFVGLLRGINVGGKNKIKMAELRALLESKGLQSVETYIQSGNLIFVSTKSEEKIAPIIKKAIKTKYGFDVPVIVRAEKQFRKTFTDIPFETSKLDQCHVMLLDKKPTKAKVNALEFPKSGRDVMKIVGSCAYMHLPDGVAKSKLTNKWLEKELGVVATARNWKTMTKLIAMLDA